MTSQYRKFDRENKLRIKPKYHKCDKDLLTCIDQALNVIMITFDLGVWVLLSAKISDQDPV